MVALANAENKMRTPFIFGENGPFPALLPARSFLSQTRAKNCFSE